MVQQELGNPVDLSAEAILELGEMEHGLRSDTPALTALFDLLRTPPVSPTFNGYQSLSMLADVRSFGLLRGSLSVAQPRMTEVDFAGFQKRVEEYLGDLEGRIANNAAAAVAEARRLCSALHDSFLSKQLTDLHERKERSEFRTRVYNSGR